MVQQTLHICKMKCGLLIFHDSNIWDTTSCVLRTLSTINSNKYRTRNMQHWTSTFWGIILLCQKNCQQWASLRHLKDMKLWTQFIQNWRKHVIRQARKKILMNKWVNSSIGFISKNGLNMPFNKIQSIQQKSQSPNVVII